MINLNWAMEKARRATVGLDWSLQGPAFAALRAARIVGWEFESGYRIIDHEGESMDLRTGSPAQLKNKFRRAWPRVQLIQGLQLRLGDLDREGEYEEEANLIDKNGWDVWPLKKALTTKAKGCLSHWEKKAAPQVCLGKPRQNHPRGMCVLWRTRLAETQAGTLPS